MKTYKELVAEGSGSPAGDFTGLRAGNKQKQRVNYDGTGIDQNRGKEFQKFHTNINKVNHPVAPDAQFKGTTEYDGEHKGGEKQAEGETKPPMAKTFQQFMRTTMKRTPTRRGDNRKGETTMPTIITRIK